MIKGVRPGRGVSVAGVAGAGVAVWFAASFGGAAQPTNIKRIIRIEMRDMP